MDRNKVKNVTNITDDMHNKVNDIYESVLDEDLPATRKSIDVLWKLLKDLKQSLKIDDL